MDVHWPLPTHWLAWVHSRLQKWPNRNASSWSFTLTWAFSVKWRWASFTSLNINSFLGQRVLIFLRVSKPCRYGSEAVNRHHHVSVEQTVPLLFLFYLPGVLNCLDQEVWGTPMNPTYQSLFENTALISLCIGIFMCSNLVSYSIKT